MDTTVRINIKDIRLRAIIGTDPAEREDPQELIVNVSMELADSRAVASDSLDDAVDYRALQQRIARRVEASSFHLLEALAGAVLGLAMEDPRVRSALVEIDKPGALPATDSVSVTCRAQREG